MNTLQDGNGALLKAPRHSLNPLAVAAAVAVILFCAVGIASMTGWIPSAFSQKRDPADVHVVDQAAASAAAEPAQAARPAAEPAQAARPAAVRAARTPAPAAASCASCGTVESVRTMEVKGEGTGLGAVAGGVTGGVLGHQIGNGNGNTVMTLLGAAGGAFAGHEIEKNVRKHYSYRVTVRMDDGTFRTISQAQPPSVAVGDKVRLANGTVVARS